MSAVGGLEKRRQGYIGGGVLLKGVSNLLNTIIKLYVKKQENKAKKGW